MSNDTTYLTSKMFLSKMDDVLLAAANNAINGSGCIIDGQNMAYEYMIRAGLIGGDGHPSNEKLGEAISAEVNRRTQEGMFNWGEGYDNE